VFDGSCCEHGKSMSFDPSASISCVSGIGIDTVDEHIRIVRRASRRILLKNLRTTNYISIGIGVLVKYSIFTNRRT